MFVAMNRFKVAAGKEADFEKLWRERESFLKGVPGFVQFALLKGDATGEYVSHTIWRDRESFVAWSSSPAFVASHRQGSVAGMLEGPPSPAVYEAVIIETDEAAG